MNLKNNCCITTHRTTTTKYSKFIELVKFRDGLDSFKFDKLSHVVHLTHMLLVLYIELDTEVLFIVHFKENSGRSSSTLNR